MKNWFSIQARANDSAEIVLFDEVGLYGITAKDFYDQLNALGDVRTIMLRINSSGGDCFTGFTIFNMLKRHKARVEVVIEGLAASISSVIAMSGDTIRMPQNSMIMVHNPWGVVVGDAEDMLDTAAVLEKVKAGIISAYRRSGKSDEEISDIMDNETWYDAQQAKEHGFCDEVIEAVQIAAFFDLKKFKDPPAALLRAPEPTPAPTDPLPPQPTPGADKLVMKAAAIVKARDDEELRQSSMKQASAIIELCNNAGHPELATEFLTRALSIDQVRAELIKPENVSSAVRLRTASRQIALADDLPDPELSESFNQEWEILSALHDDLAHPENAAELWESRASIEALTADVDPEPPPDFPPLTESYRQYLRSLVR